MSLPLPCGQCKDSGGYWTYGGKRCSCERGQQLLALDGLRSLPPDPHVEPKISEETAAAGVSMLSAMKFFPSEAGARLLIADELRSMCSDATQMVWLAKRCNTLFTDWPGMPALRRVFWSKFIPIDRMPAMGAIGKDDPYPEGIPSEVPESFQYAALGAGEVHPALRKLGNAKDLNVAIKRDEPIN